MLAGRIAIASFSCYLQRKTLSYFVTQLQQRTYNSVLSLLAKGNDCVSVTCSNPSSLGGRLRSPAVNPKGKKSPKGTPPTCSTLQMTAQMMQHVPTGQPLLYMIHVHYIQFIAIVIYSLALNILFQHDKEND